MRISSTLAHGSSLFFPLFFIPIGSAGGFSVDANLIAVALLSLCSVLQYRLVLKNRFIVAFLIPSLLMLFASYLFSYIVLGNRATLPDLVVQIFFFVAAVGLFAQFSAWCKDNESSEQLTWFLALSCLSFAFSFVAFAPSEAMAGLVAEIFRLNPPEVVKYTRYAFVPDVYSGKVELADVTNYQNRVAQYLFSLAFIVFSMRLYQTLNFPTSKLLTFFLYAFSACVTFFSVLLMSGRVLAELSMTVSVGLAAWMIWKPGMRSAMVSFSIVAFSGILLAYTASTGLGESWGARLSSDDISTGRVDIWNHYLSDAQYLTILGSEKSVSIDTHNLLLTLLFETGLLGIAAISLLLLPMIGASLAGIFKGVRKHGVPAVLFMSVGLQMFLIINISGGFGFPGWAEVSKFSVFLFGLSLLNSPHPAQVRSISPASLAA